MAGLSLLTRRATAADIPTEIHHMTGYTVHTGASKKFVQGWDRIFSGAEQQAEQPETAAGKTKSKEKSRQREGTSKRAAK